MVSATPGSRHAGGLDPADPVSDGAVIRAMVLGNAKNCATFVQQPLQSCGTTVLTNS
jgi:hypothetical protein